MPTILGWKRPGTIGRRQHKYSSIAQPVEHATVNRRVVGSSPTWGASILVAAVIFSGGVFYYKKIDKGH